MASMSKFKMQSHTNNNTAAMGRCDEDPSNIRSISSRRADSKRDSAARRGRRSKLVDYSSIGKRSSSTNNLVGRNGKLMCSSNHGGQQNLAMELNDSSNSLSLESLQNLPITELRGLQLNARGLRDEEESLPAINKTDGKESRMSSVSLRNIKQRYSLESRMPSASLHNLHSSLGPTRGSSHRNSLMSLASAPPELNRQQSYKRQNIIVSLEQALNTRKGPDSEEEDNPKKAEETPSGAVKFRLKKSPSSTTVPTPNHAKPGMNRASTGGALDDLLKKSRRDKLVEVLNNPHSTRDLKRTSLKGSFQSISAVGANQKQRLSSPKLNELFAKKEAKLNETFNEGMRNFSPMEEDTPRKPFARRASMSWIGSNASVVREGSSGTMNLLDQEDTSSSSKTCIVEYMKEVRRSCGRAKRQPSPSDRPASKEEEEAEIEALKALAGQRRARSKKVSRSNSAPSNALPQKSDERHLLSSYTTNDSCCKRLGSKNNRMSAITA